MKRVFIKDKLAELDVKVSDLNLGNFSYVGEYCAKKMREKDSPLWKSAGSFFMPNYERGLLIYSLIKRYNLQSYLEIGFGRGYSAVCAAMAFHDLGIDGTVTTIDPVVDERHMQLLNQVIPADWLRKVKFMKGTSQQVLPTLPDKYDLVYIDGDHKAPAVQSDWDNVRNKWNAFCLFDDYHLPTKQDSAQAGIECAQVIDRIDPHELGNVTKELILMDRRIFHDDRGVTDEQLDYGQVLLTNKDFVPRAAAKAETDWKWNWE